MTTLITGGAGFIGSNLARQLLARGHRIRIIDDLSTGELSHLEGLEVTVIEADILDHQSLTRAMSGVDSVIHLAAIASVPASLADPVRTHRVNVDGTFAVLEAARAAGRVWTMVASSSAVLGTNQVTPTPELTWTRPISPYGVSKLATEAYANAYRLSYGLPTLAIRLFNVYGPRQSADHPYAAVVPRFIDAALRGVPLELHGDGRQVRDFTHVDTVCAAIAMALERRISHVDPINVALGTRADLRALIAAIEAQLGPVRIEQHPPRPGDVTISQADGRRLAELFGEVPVLDLSAGIAATIAWHRAHRRLPA